MGTASKKVFRWASGALRGRFGHDELDIDAPRVVLASADVAWLRPLEQALRQRWYDLQVVDELSHLLFAYEELRHAGAAAPELVVLDEHLAPTGTLFVWIDRILERSAVVVMCDEASSAFHEEALSLGVSALLPRSADTRTFALTVRRALDAHAVATRVRAFGAGAPSFAPASRASR